MKRLQSWIVFINEENEYDAIPFDLDKEKEIKGKGLKILGWPLFRDKEDAIDYAKGVFG